MKNYLVLFASLFLLYGCNEPNKSDLKTDQTTNAQFSFEKSLGPVYNWENIQITSEVISVNDGCVKFQTVIKFVALGGENTYTETLAIGTSQICDDGVIGEEAEGCNDGVIGDYYVHNATEADTPYCATKLIMDETGYELFLESFPDNPLF